LTLREFTLPFFTELADRYAARMESPLFIETLRELESNELREQQLTCNASDPHFFFFFLFLRVISD
jgi:hypothetical protein